MCHILNLDSTGGCNDKIKRCHIVNFELATIQQNYKDAFYLTISLKKISTQLKYAADIFITVVQL